MDTEQFEELFNDVVAQELELSKCWWWLSFCDTTKPEGQQFLGVAIVEAHGIATAMIVTRDKGINPGGQIAAWALPLDAKIPENFTNKLLTKDEAELLNDSMTNMGLEE